MVDVLCWNGDRMLQTVGSQLDTEIAIALATVMPIRVKIEEVNNEVLQ